MQMITEAFKTEKFFLSDDGVFPNNRLPALLYKNVLALPLLNSSSAIEKLFKQNNWTNSWKYGIFTYHHYHSTTHEVLGAYKGKTTVLLGGHEGIQVEFEKGDVLIIPAGTAHKNLGELNAVSCVGAYPDGRLYDMNYGKIGERPSADKNIKSVPLPETDPVFGVSEGLMKYWKDSN